MNKMQKEDIIKCMAQRIKEEHSKYSKNNEDWSEIASRKLFSEYEITLRNNSVITRYFFVCTIGKNPNGTFGFNSFEVKTTYGHPTFRRCIELSNERFPNMNEVTLISISEISAEDYNVFVSEQ